MTRTKPVKENKAKKYSGRKREEVERVVKNREEYGREEILNPEKESGRFIDNLW